MEGDLSDGELPDEHMQPPSRDDRPDADPALVRRGPASSYPPTASDRVQRSVDATICISKITLNEQHNTLQQNETKA